MIGGHMMRRGQVWSSDFAMSIGVFAVAAVIAFTIIINTVGEQEYESARQQAVGAAALLAGEGYPLHWEQDTVIRAGLMSNNRLSMRKVHELSLLDPLELRKALRTTDNTYVYFTQDGETVGLFGTCGVGDMAVASTPRNGSINAVAMAPAGATLAGRLNVTLQVDDAVYRNLSQQDLIIIEGVMNANLSDDEISRNIHEAARNGMMMVVVGDPGIPVLGIAVNATTPLTLDVVRDEFMLQTGEALSVAGAIPTIEIPADPAVGNFEMIAQTPDGKAAYATWTYDDARVWYFATADAVHANGTSVAVTLGNATAELLNVQRPECANVTLPGAKQVATHTRTIAHHDELVDIHVLVWRD